MPPMPRIVASNSSQSGSSTRQRGRDHPARVARRAGIAAPSIYAHFPDRDAIVDAVVERAFAELDAALAAAVEGVDDPAARPRALCEAYVAFADERPQRYRVAFERHRRGPRGEARALADLSGGQAFGRLVAVVAGAGNSDAGSGRNGSDDGGSGSGSPELDATALWVALHGYAVLSAGLPAFPWPDRGRMIDRILARFSAR